ncbi:MAG: HDOD domain-containing protein [Gammaproteobacteria bacterium]|nr:MAG: HDOD domain-containing protein [Gammaproteobacteria bacterium]
MWPPPEALHGQDRILHQGTSKNPERPLRTSDVQRNRWREAIDSGGTTKTHFAVPARGTAPDSGFPGFPPEGPGAGTLRQGGQLRRVASTYGHTVIPMHRTDSTGPDPGLDELLEGVPSLVSPPLVCMKLLDILESDSGSAAQMGEVIAQDPNLTSRLLRLVNSAFYNLPSPVETVSRAITIIGTRDLYNLVLAISATATFSGLSPRLVNIDTFWRHSLYCGLIARNLARRLNVLHPERLFVSGLLHDVGALVLYTRAADAAKELLLVAAGDEAVFHLAELDQLGFSHAEIGAIIMREWRLSPAQQEAIAHHHQPGRAGQAPLETAIVHLADVMANRSDIGNFCEAVAPEARFDPAALEIAGLEEAALDPEQAVAEAGLQFAETVSVMFAR